MVIPDYIAKAHISGAPVRHTWKSDEHFIRDSPAMEKQFFATTFRGVAAIATGTAEWIVWRFEGLSESSDAKQYIEACWAGMINPLYRVEWRGKKEADITGPIEQPLAHCCALLDRVYHLATIKSNGAAGNAIYLAYLARHVMPKKAPFEDWLKFAFSRCAEMYPRSQADPLGPPVPREALDAHFSFDPTKAPALLSNFLERLDPSTNPYLRSADEMITLGFIGTPYKL